MNKIISYIYLIILIDFSLIMQSCNDIDEMSIDTTTSNHCTADDDCGDGVCSDEGFCYLESIDTPLELAIEVVPKEDASNIAPSLWTFQSFSVSGSLERDVVMPAPVRLVGKVRYGSTVVPSRITVIGEKTLPGNNPKTSSTTTSGEPEVEEEDNEEYDYDFLLALGETVTVRVEPIALPDLSDFYQYSEYQAYEVLPPLTQTITLDSQFERIDFEYSPELFDPCTSEKTSGCTLALELDEISFGEEDDLFLDGIIVNAIDDETGLVISSLQSVTSENEYLIELRIAPDANAWSIFTSPTDERPEFPVFNLSEIAAAEGVNIFVDSLSVPIIEPVTVTGYVENSNATVIGGCTIRFQSTIDLSGYYESPLSATVDQTITSNSAIPSTDYIPGGFETQLVPGTYQVIVIPPSVNDGAILTTEITIEANPIGEQVIEHFTLPDAIAFGGVIKDFNGNTLDYAYITSLPWPDETGRASGTDIDSGGLFSMFLDEGIYDFVLIHTDDSYYGHTIIPHIMIESPSSTSEVTVALSPPIVIEGNVVASDETSLPNSVVVIHRILRDGAARTVPATETSTDEFGRYRAFLQP